MLIDTILESQVTDMPITETEFTNEHITLTDVQRLLEVPGIGKKHI